ncbi:type IV pili methyl-accepting chemotaxis transducer N-terminal domain-containing protein [Wenyingzhuangia sp. IMCC45574]
MKKIYTLFIMFSMFFVVANGQEKLHLSHIVNLAGKQRMLGQRIAKDKVFIKANQLKENAEVEQEKAIAAFESGLAKIKSYAPTETIKYKVSVQEYAFKYYKKEVLKGSNSSMEDVINTNTIFLAICDDLVTELIKYSKIKTKENKDKNQRYILEKIAEATGASGKLRYLTQRLTLYFAMREFAITTVKPAEIDEIFKTMDENLNYLTILEFNTLEIDDALSQVQYHWSKIKKAIYTDGVIDLNKSQITAKELFNLANTVLQKANTATKMYADLNKS